VLDETAEAIRLLGGALDHLRRSPTAGANATVGQALALALYESGSWTAARNTLDEAYRTAAEAGLENVATGSPVLGATLLALRGDTEEARAAVQRAVQGVDLARARSLQVRTHYALGAAALAEGDHASAYDRFRAVFTRDVEPEPLHYHASDYCLADLAAAAVRTGWADEARLVLDAARKRLAEGEMSARLAAIVGRAQALLAEGDDAEQHFRAALADPEGDQWPFERAKVRLDTRSGCAGAGARSRRAHCSARRSTPSNGSAPARGPNAPARNCGPRASSPGPRRPCPRTCSKNSLRSNSRSPASRLRA